MFGSLRRTAMVFPLSKSPNCRIVFRALFDSTMHHIAMNNTVEELHTPCSPVGGGGGGRGEGRGGGWSAHYYILTCLSTVGENRSFSPDRGAPFELELNELFKVEFAELTPPRRDESFLSIMECVEE